MFQYLTSRPALAATTSVAALAIGIAVILPVADLRLPSGGYVPERTRAEAPKPEADALTPPVANATAPAPDAATRADAKIAAPADVAPTGQATAPLADAGRAVASPPMTALGTTEAMPAAPRRWRRHRR